MFLIAVLPAEVWAYAEGPDAGVSGVPREASCTACHRSGTFPGSVAVQFAAGLTYSPGVKQHLAVTINDPAQKRWGFQLTAREAGNSAAQAGTFTPGADGYTQIVCTQTNFLSESFGKCDAGMPLQYIEHTKNGTRPGERSPVNFEFDWTPPDHNAGAIIVYVAANAANGDGTEGGDHIYLQHYTLSVASPPPSISSAGVDCGATLEPTVAAGSWVTIKGAHLAGTTRTWRANEIVNGTLPVALDGVSVSIDSKAAAIYYISPEQINALAPADTALGPVNVQVTYNGATSNPATLTLQSAAPAFFLWSSKYAVATRTDFSYVGPPDLFPGLTTPARPGDVVILWGGGFGPTSPTVAGGVLTPSTPVALTTATPVVTVGNLPATVLGAALAPGLAGVYQIAVQVPADLGNGDQPVNVTIDGIPSFPGSFLNVHQ